MTIPSKAWLDIFSAVMAGLLLYATSTKRKNSQSDMDFFRLVLCLIPLLLCDAGLWFLETYRNPLLLKLDFFAIYTLALLFICLFALYLMHFLEENYGITSGRRLLKASPIIFIFFEVLWLSSFFTGFFFHFTEDGWYTYTQWHLLSQLGASFILLPQYIVVYRNRRKIGRQNVLIWTIYLVVSLVVRYLDLTFNLPLIYPVITLLVLLVYMTVNVDIQNKMKDQEMEKQDTQQKVMISQIQPHFLYNVLNTIVYLCRKNPELAAETTVDFATYLRMNLNSLAENVPVPFETELEHTKTYLKLEKRRFDDVLEIEYDIQATDFFIPVLTLQPLVENAVKHGICMLEDGGKVTIRSYDDMENYYVEVNDTGAGFDTSRSVAEDGKIHIGLSNTIRRIRDLDGEVVVRSAVGKGTSICISLPKTNNATFRKKND